MRAMNSIEIASMAVSNTNSTFIVIELDTGGPSSRWAEQFPTLDVNSLDMDRPVFLEYGTWLEAANAFDRITADCVAANTGSPGTITFVGTPYNEDDGVATFSWDMQDNARPVFSTESRQWNYVEIAERV